MTILLFGFFHFYADEITQKLAVFYEKKGNFELAEKLYNYSLAQNDKNSKTYILYLRFLGNHGNTETLTSNFSKISNDFSNNFDVRYEYLRSLYKKDQYELASKSAMALPSELSEKFKPLIPPPPIPSHQSGYYSEEIEFGLRPDSALLHFIRIDEDFKPYDTLIKLGEGAHDISVFSVSLSGIVSEIISLEITIDAKEAEVAFINPQIEEIVREELSLSEGSLTSENLNAITTLDLSGIPTTDQNFTDLKHFSSLNSLTLSSLANVKMLDLPPSLNYLKISDGVSSEILSSLKTLTNLTHLEITNSNLTSVSNFAEMDGLNFLNLSGNQISDVSELTYCENLETLILSENNIQNINPLRNMQNLNHLDLSENLISELPDFRGMQNLTFLSLRNNNVGSIHSVRYASGLMVFDVSGNEISDFSPLNTNKNLSKIYIDDIDDNDTISVINPSLIYVD